MKTHILCRAIAPALLLLSAHHAVAGTFTFNPGANNNWNDHNNWDGTPGQFPDDDSDTAIIGGSQMLDLGEDTTIGSLTLSGIPTGSSTISGGGFTLVVDNLATFTGTGEFVNGFFSFETGAVPGGLTVGADASVYINSTTLGVAGVGPGTLRLAGGGFFSNEIAFVLYDESDISIGAGGGTFQNNGSFAKAAGNSSSIVHSRFHDFGGGVISNASSASLRFNGATSLTGSNLSVTGGSVTALSGESTITGATITLAAGSEFWFDSGTHTLSGVLTATGDGSATAGRARGGAVINGGTLDFAAGAPFIVDNAVLGATGNVTNAGSFQWRGGSILGSGVENIAATPGSFVITATGTPTPREIDEFGQLHNAGHMTIDGASFAIGLGSTLSNQGGATLLINGTVISRVSGTTGGIVRNSGMLIKDTAGFATIRTDFINEPGASLQINASTLTVADRVVLRGDVNVSRASSTTSQLIIGPNGGSNSAATIGGTQFTLNAAATTTPLVAITGGSHTLDGTLTISGTGRIEQSGGTLSIAGGASAQFVTDATSRFRLDGGSAAINIEGAFTNSGNFDWDTGTVSGPSAFVNSSAGTLTVTGGGTATLSNGTAGRLENFGLLSVQASQSLRLKNGATLVNQAGGGAQRLELLGNTSGILKFDGTVTTALFQNEGLLQKGVSGTSTIGVPFEQISPGSTEVLAGTLVLNGGYDIEGSPLTISGATSLLRVNSSGSLGNVAINFSGGGVFEFAGAAVEPAHKLSGAITLSGNGRMDHVGGVVLVELGKQALIQPDATSRFRLNGGGALIRTEGTFRNHGAFEWLAGTIGGAGEFSNEAGALLTVSTGGFHTLSDGVNGTLVNRGGLLVNEDITLEHGARLENFGSMELRADIVKGGAAVIGIFKNFSSLLVPATSTISSNFRNGGNVVVSNTTLRITGEAAFAGGTVFSNGALAHVDMSDAENLMLGGGATFQSVAGGIFTFGKNTGTTKIATVVEESVVETVTDLVVNNTHIKSTPGGTGRVSTVGGGSVTHNGGTLGGTGTVEINGNYTGNNVTTEGVVINTPNGNFTLNGGTLGNGAGSTFTSDGVLRVLGGNIGGTLNLNGLTRWVNPNQSLTTAERAQITNNGLFKIEANGSLVFDTDTFIRNTANALIELNSGGSLTLAPGATGAVLDNAGTVVKNSPGTTAITIPVTNTGTLSATAGTLELAGGLAQLSGGTLSGGTYIASGGATISTPGPQVVTTIGAGATIEQRGAGSKVFVFPHVLDTSSRVDINGAARIFDSAIFVTYSSDISGTLHAGGEAQLELNQVSVISPGVLKADSGASIIADILRVESGGQASISGGASVTVDSLTVEPGALVGGISGGIVNVAQPFTNRGTVSGNLTINSPLNLSVFGFAPGNSAGLITVNGDFTQTAPGFLDIELDGLAPGTGYDVLDVNGAVTLGGTLNVFVLGGAVGLPAGSFFDILTGNTIAGTFDTLNLPLDPTGGAVFSVSYLPQSVRLTALQTIPEPSSAVLLLGGLALLLRRRTERAGCA
jgi:hypothetical protein